MSPDHAAEHIDTAAVNTAMDGSPPTACGVPSRASADEVGISRKITLDECSPVEYTAGMLA